LTDNAGGRFAIDVNTGLITVANGALLDYGSATSHGITVRVTDQGGLTYSESFTIGVLRDQVTVQNGNGTSTTTIYDATSVYPWDSFRTDSDANGNPIYQKGINDGGGTWENEYDSSGGHGWWTRMTVHNAANQLVTQTTNNIDGSHTLTANDVSDSYNWATFTMQFDPGWNVVSITGTNNDGTHTMNANDIWSSLDTLLWYATPYIVTRAPLGGPSDWL